jgi:helicase-like protein
MDRKRAMDGIRNGAIRIMIASDLAARGLNIPDVTHIFNLDVPTMSKAYTFYQRRYTGLSDTELGGGLTLRPASLLDVLAQGSHEISTHGEHMRFGLIKSEIAEHTTVRGCRMLNIAFAHDFSFLSDRSGVPPDQCPLCESSEFSLQLCLQVPFQSQ